MNASQEIIVPAGQDQSDDLLAQVYDVALDPTRYEELVDFWEQAHGLQRGAFDDTRLEKHFQRAAAFIERIEDPEDELTATLAPFDRVAAFVVGADMRVLACNDIARKNLSLDTGDDLASMSLDPSEVAPLRDGLGQLLGRGQANKLVYRLRGPAADQVVIAHLFRLELAHRGSVAIIVTSLLNWPEGFEAILKTAFGLTGAEASVVRQLVLTSNLQDVAANRGRSIATIRTQLKSILHKTETKSQVELVRLVLSMMDIALTPAVPVNDAGADLIPGYRTHCLPDGRRLDYRVIGDPRGKPVLFWPMDYGFHHWSRQAERAAARMGLRVIVPVRGGYGFSDPLPQSVDVVDQIAHDVCDLLDHLKIRRCPSLALGIDLMLAVRFAALFPGRCTQIVACAGGLPIHDHSHLDRMDKWHRMILATAHYTPRLLPFLVKAGFSYARRQGKETFVRAVFGGSEADMQIFADPEVREAMLRGTEMTLSKRFSAHETFARVTAYQMTQDWGQSLTALRGKVPIHCLCGLQDTQIPPDVLDSYKQAFPWISFQTFGDAGRLLFFRHWDVALKSLFSPQK